VRLPGAYRDLFAGLDKPRSAKALSDAEPALVHEKPLLLAEVPVERPAVSATACMHVRSEQIAVGFENLGAQPERRTFENVAGRNGVCVLVN
jgi:hypothetical protein